MEFLVKSYSDEGDTVIDPFMGSGTTGVAALQNNRRFIGIEKERQYFETACQRIQQAYAERQKPMEKNYNLFQTDQL
jgi:site-specific DNA-methyltransferase (adenine-specific)